MTIDIDADAYQRELMTGVARGDEQSFGALYDCFSRSLYGLGLRMLGDPRAAEEMVQEAMLKVWRSAPKFDPGKGRVSSWIFTVARRTGLDMARSNVRSPVPVEEIPETPDLAASEAEQWRDWEIASLLMLLSEEQRTAVEMFVIEGHTQVHMAEALGIPLGTVKTRIYTGLRRLREHLETSGLVEVTT